MLHGVDNKFRKFFFVERILINHHIIFYSFFLKFLTTSQTLEGKAFCCNNYGLFTFGNTNSKFAGMGRARLGKQLQNCMLYITNKTNPFIWQIRGNYIFVSQTLKEPLKTKLKRNCFSRRFLLQSPQSRRLGILTKTSRFNFERKIDMTWKVSFHLSW